MYSLFIISSLLLMNTFITTTFTMTLKRHYRRPICESSHSCSYSYQQFTFELCDCPNMEACPLDNGIQLRGITYQFCSSRNFPTCGNNEIAAEVNVLQTSIFCICPHNQIYIKQKDTTNANAKYICQEKAMCKPGQTCEIGNLIVGIKSVCQCANNHRCIPWINEVFNPVLIQNATCQPL